MCVFLRMLFKIKNCRYQSYEDIVKNLEGISDLLYVDLESIDGIYDINIFKWHNKITFRTENMLYSSQIKRIGLNSLICENDFRSIGKGVCWRVEYKEYSDKYKNTYKAQFEEIREILRLLEDIKNIDQNSHIFIRYDETLLTVKNALEICKEENEELNSEVVKKSMEILESFKDSVLDILRKESDFDKMNKEAVSKSLQERLDLELEYLKKVAK